MSISTRKRQGVVYTPPSVVALILDNALPAGADGLGAASVCDPACGEGAFLVAVARRLLTRLGRADALAALGRMAGYDIDAAAIARCRSRLDDTLAQWHPGARVQWNLQVRNAFDRDAFAADWGRFTHIVGNPPYVRVQHLEQTGRRRIAGRWRVTRGATDLFLVFYELGLALLGSGGLLGYIAPSSWLRSASGAALRQLLAQSHRVERIIDFGEHQVFDDVTTYTAVTIIRKDGAPADIPVSKYDGARFYDAGAIALDAGNPAHTWLAATAADAGTGPPGAAPGGGCGHPCRHTDAGRPGIHPAGGRGPRHRAGTPAPAPRGQSVGDARRAGSGAPRRHFPV